MLVEFAVDMFGVGDIGDRPPAPFDAIADAAAWMVEVGGADDNARLRPQHIARIEIVPAEPRLADLDSSAGNHGGCMKALTISFVVIMPARWPDHIDSLMSGSNSGAKKGKPMIWS